MTREHIEQVNAKYGEWIRWGFVLVFSAVMWYSNKSHEVRAAIDTTAENKVAIIKLSESDANQNVMLARVTEGMIGLRTDVQRLATVMERQYARGNQ